MRQVIVYRDEDGYWVVECPSLKGCLSQGKTKQEALFNIKEAIAGYVAALEEDGLPVPEENFETLPRMDHPFSKWITDQIVLDFGRDYPSIIEFSNYAITEVINLKAKNLFREATRFLDKDHKKLILRRFRFLLDSEIQCVTLRKSVLEQSINLFYEFLSNYNTKREVKNTINDIIILATAIDLSAVLITKDSLLNTFASEYFDTVLQVQKDFITIDFGTKKGSNRSKNRESKEYINKD